MVFVRDTLHGARPEHHPLIHAPLQELVLERDAVHLAVRALQLDAVRVFVVDYDFSEGPHFVEAIGEAE